MKLSFSADEVLDIVLQHVRQEFPRSCLNKAEVDGYCSSFNGVVVSYEDTPMAVAVGVAVAVAVASTVPTEELLG